MFNDMTIHDFDMARYVTGSEVVHEIEQAWKKREVSETSEVPALLRERLLARLDDRELVARCDQAVAALDAAGAELDAAEIEQIENLVNVQVLENTEITTEALPMDEAKSRGAIGIFEEKYGDEVRVISFGDFSTELCGGTHAAASGEMLWAAPLCRIALSFGSTNSSSSSKIFPSAASSRTRSIGMRVSGRISFSTSNLLT